jgi:hypothetical protein
MPFQISLASSVIVNGVLLGRLQIQYQNSQRKVKYEFSDLSNADVLVAEFRESVLPAIPKIIDFLSNKRNSNFRMAGANSLANLSEPGKGYIY